jgi:hypothetical protein
MKTLRFETELGKMFYNRMARIYVDVVGDATKGI